MYIEHALTKSLEIRPLSMSDAGDWEFFFKNNDSLPYLGIDLEVDDKTQSREWIESQLKRYRENRFGHCALINKSTGKFIGQCGLLTQEIEGVKEIEVGYHILPEYWGRGYATEAAKFFRDFAFENDLTDSLISVIDIRNTGSQNVAQKNGMKNTKQIKCYGLDVFIYRITKEEWRDKEVE
jgi:RimJ/RimL family protein N-acetyltransferase